LGPARRRRRARALRRRGAARRPPPAARRPSAIGFKTDEVNRIISMDDSAPEL